MFFENISHKQKGSDYFFRWKIFQSFWEILKPTQECFLKISVTSRKKGVDWKENLFGLLLPVKSLSILLRNLKTHTGFFWKYPSQAERKEWIKKKSRSDYFFRWKVFQSFWEILRPTQECLWKYPSQPKRKDWIKKKSRSGYFFRWTVFQSFWEIFKPTQECFLKTSVTSRKKGVD